MPRVVAAVALVVLLPLTLAADTLVLRDGTRVQGELIAVRGGVIEFEERRGFGRGRRLEFDRDDVVRIEFESAREADRGRGFAGGPPAGMRERQVMVAANAAWTDTGIDLRSGQTVYFEAAGNVRWGRDRRDGPEGERNSPPNANRPMPNRPAAALIGRVGEDSTDLFFIGGETGPVRIRASGRLFLGVNDDFLPDNSGSFRVVVRY